MILQEVVLDGFDLVQAIVLKVEIRLAHLLVTLQNYVMLERVLVLLQLVVNQ